MIPLERIVPMLIARHLLPAGLPQSPLHDPHILRSIIVGATGIVIADISTSARKNTTEAMARLFMPESSFDVIVRDRGMMEADAICRTLIAAVDVMGQLRPEALIQLARQNGMSSGGGKSPSPSTSSSGGQ